MTLTARLRLRPLDTGDAAVIHELLNEPGWLRFIGDRGIRTLDDASRYVQGPAASRQKNGFALDAVTLKDEGTPIGICGLIKRDALDDVDIGFAFLQRFSSHGYATEAAAAVLAQGHRQFGLKRIVAITAPDNLASIRVLQKIGMRYEKTLDLGEHGGENCLFASEV
jgi:[ribosomal protein S5]-alanine N-acetyltransferase